MTLCLMFENDKGRFDLKIQKERNYDLYFEPDFIRKLQSIYEIK